MTGSGLDRSPEAVVAAARATEWSGGDDGGDDTARTPTANVVVADPDADGAAKRVDGGYEGPDAAACGHLAAALSVADSDDIRLHHGDVDLASPGPWLVLAPLSGVVATVATGTATATVTVPLDGTGNRIQPVRDRLDAVLSAARARHEHYPVADDDRGVFRTGMTTFSLVDATVDTALDVRFDVSTTPATTRSGIVERFASLSSGGDATGGPVGVESEVGEGGDVEVDVAFEVGVERAEPSDDLRDAVEAAHRAVVGDAGYEWLPRPTVFSRLPTSEKVAFGVGEVGNRIDGDDVDRTRDLLRRVVDRLVDREAHGR